MLCLRSHGRTRPPPLRCVTLGNQGVVTSLDSLLPEVGVCLTLGRAAGVQAQASAAVPALRGRPGSTAASLRGSPGSTTTLGSAAEEVPARGSYADLRSAHMGALPVRVHHGANLVSTASSQLASRL